LAASRRESRATLRVSSFPPHFPLPEKKKKHKPGVAAHPINRVLFLHILTHTTLAMGRKSIFFSTFPSSLHNFRL
jgi:hypothetical protein